MRPHSSLTSGTSNMLLQQKDVICNHTLHLVELHLFQPSLSSLLQCGIVPQSFLDFHNLKAFDEYVPVILWDALQFGFAQWFFIIKFRLCMHLWLECHSSDALFFLLHPVRWYMIFICSISDDAHFDHLIKVVSAGIQYCKVILGHFVVSIL